MPDIPPENGPVIFDFRAQYAWDSAHGGALPVAEYERRFPGFEAVVRAEYAVLSCAEPPLALTRILSTKSSGETVEPELDRMIAQYRLLKILGRGGQGAVYLAEDTRLRRKVALKVLSGLSQFSPEALKRFRREAETASKLDHPGICTIYESGIDGETPFIAMRYVEGDSLAKRIANARKDRKERLTQKDLKTRRVQNQQEKEAQTVGGATAASTRSENWTNRFFSEEPTRINLPAPVAPSTREELWSTMRFFEEAARALHAAHEAGVIHRDVKPGNLMVTPSGNAIVLDFGIARETEPQMDSLTGTGDVLGTPGYMSPEQLEPRGKKLDRRTDIYSLGVALYECVTLDLPFMGPTLETLYRAILRDQPRDPRLTNRAVPRELSIVLETALEKDRDRRYVTALEMAEDLRRIRTYEAILARPAGPWLKTVRWVQRNPTHAIGLAAGLFFVAIGAFTAMVMRDSKRTRVLNDGLNSANAEIQAQNVQISADRERIEANRKRLDQDNRDRLMSQLLLSLHADVPTRGVYLDWPRVIARREAALAGFGLPLDGNMTSLDFVEAHQAISARDKELGAEILDSLYRTATQLDDVEIRAFKELDRGVPDDLSVAAVRAGEWPCLRARLSELIDRLESDPWRRELWSSFRAFVDHPVVDREQGLQHVDQFDTFLGSDVLASRASSDLLRLGDYVDLARRDFTALVVYDAANEKPFESAGVRYAIRVYRGYERFTNEAYEEACVDFDAARELQPEAAPTFIGMARAWRALKRPHEALTAIRRATELDPRNAFALGLEGEMCLSAGQFSAGLAAARKSAELSPLAPTPLAIQGRAHLLLAASIFERDDADVIRDVKIELLAALDTLARAVELGGEPEATWDEAASTLIEETSVERALSILEALPARRRESGRLWQSFGRAAWRDGDRAAALDAFERARTDAPRDASLALETGKLYLAIGELDRAEEHLTSAVELAPKSIEAREKLAEAFMQLRRPSDARATLEEALALDPRNARILSYITWPETMLEDFDAALDSARKAVELDPKNADLHGNLASVLERRGDADGALEERLEELACSPTHLDTIDVVMRLAFVGDGAKPRLERVLEFQARHPGHLFLDIAAAFALTGTEGLARSVEELESIARRDPKDATALSCLARWQATFGMRRQASDAARRALARNPAEYAASVVLATNQCLDFDYRRAVETAQAGLRGAARDEALRLRLVEAEIGSGRVRDAIDHAREGLKNENAPVELAALLARAHSAAGEHDEACRIADGATALAPNDPGIAIARGLCYLDAGRFTEAAGALRSACESAPLELACSEARCFALVRAGQIDEASTLERSTRLAFAEDPVAAGMMSEWSKHLDAARRLGAQSKDAEPDASPFDVAWAHFVRGEFALSRAAYETAFHKDSLASPRPSDDDDLDGSRLIWAARAAARDGEERLATSPADVDALAARALDHLELDLLLRDRDRRNATPARSLAEHRHRLRQTLTDRDLWLVRAPPAGASWIRRAEAHRERVLDVLARWADGDAR